MSDNICVDAHIATHVSSNVHVAFAHASAYVVVVRWDQWVGLRPFRLGGVRLEYEYYKGKLHVIHNYGHGGSGVTLSWGCAKEVANIAKAKLYDNKAQL